MQDGKCTLVVQATTATTATTTTTGLLSCTAFPSQRGTAIALTVMLSIFASSESIYPFASTRKEKERASDPSRHLFIHHQFAQ